ncbi:MAG: hypothetical protein EXR62_16095 [Chloroflexi bacterium]|nr:hypothetical protein [Chloroflexota bacterium]
MFDQSLFTDLSLKKEEQTRDYKVKLPDLDNNEDLADFIADIIAFANVARRRDERCYLIYGVDDKKREICSLVGQHLRRVLRNLPSDPDGADFERATEVMEMFLAEKLRDFIIPRPECRLQRSRLEPDNKIVGYIEIFPSMANSFFCVKKELKDHDKYFLRLQETYYRFASRTEKVESDQTEWLIAANQAAFVPQEGWRMYFEDTFHRTDDPTRLVELMVKVTGEEQQLDDALLNFARGTDAPSVAQLLGYAGSGKTISLQRLVHKFADEALQTLSNSTGEIVADERLPDILIPIYVDISKSNSIANDHDLLEVLETNIKNMAKPKGDGGIL